MQYMIYLLFISFFYANVIFSVPFANKITFLASDIIAIFIIIFFIFKLITGNKYSLKINDKAVKFYMLFIYYCLFGFLFFLFKFEYLSTVSNSISYLFEFILLLLLFIVLQNEDNKIKINKIHVINIILGITTSIYGIIMDFILQLPRDYISGSGLIPRPVPLVTSTFTYHYATVGLFLIISLASLEILRLKSVITTNIIYYPAVLTIVSAILLSGARRALVMLIIFYGLILSYKLYRGLSNYKTTRTFNMIFSVIFFSILIFMVFGSYGSYIIDSSRIFSSLENNFFTDHIRNDITQSSIDTLKNNPLILLFGNGVGTYSSLESTFGGNAHNLYFQYIIETGVLGSFVFILYLLQQIKRRKRQSQEVFVVKISLVTSVLVLGISGEVLYPVEAFGNYFLFFNLYLYILNSTIVEKD